MLRLSSRCESSRGVISDISTAVCGHGTVVWKSGQKTLDTHTIYSTAQLAEGPFIYYTTPPRSPGNIGKAYR